MRTTGTAVAVLLSTACGPTAAPPGATVIDSAGITIVVNDAVDRPLGWQVQPGTTYGGADEGPEAFFEVTRALVAVSPDDRIYVLDRTAHRIVRIHPDGAVDIFVEGRGEGPGELERPVGVGVAPDGDVVVVDAAKGRYVRYAPDGTLRHERMTDSFDTFAPRADSGVILVDQEYATDGYTQFLRFLPGPELARTALARVTRYRLQSCGASPNFMAPVIFAPDIVWSRSAEVVAVNTEPGYVINLYDGTRITRSLRRTMEPIPGSMAAAEAWSRANPSRVRFAAGGECIHDPSEVASKREFAATVPIVSEIIGGPNGELWIRRTTDDFTETVTDVFDADGVYLGTLAPEFPAPLGFLSDGELLYMTRDELDVERLARGRVVRNGSE